jgi:hypothetical protein
VREQIGYVCRCVLRVLSPPQVAMASANGVEVTPTQRPGDKNHHALAHSLVFIWLISY